MTAKPAAVLDFAADLAPQLQGDVRTDTYNRVLYSTDASIYQVMPLAVVVPRNADDVIAAVQTAARYQLPVLPRGGGTSLAGQTVNEAVIIDLSRLSRILEINAAERWVRVEPGIIRARLNAALGQRGFKFGPDPATDNRAQIGGITGNNSTGSHSILYGMTADQVMQMDTVLADGSRVDFGPLSDEEVAQKAALDSLEGQVYRGLTAILAEHGKAIRDRLPRTWRRCGGYNLERLIPGATDNVSPMPPQRWADDRFNLAKLMTGSEGTLGTVLGVQLNLVPLPRAKGLAVLHFDDLYAALEAIPALLEVGPSAVELLDQTQMDLCRQSEVWSRRLYFVEGRPSAVLITEFYGENEAEVAAKLDRLAALVKGLPVGAMPRLTDARSQADVWDIRKAGLGLLMSLRGDAKPLPFIEDVAVPVDHLASYIRDVQRVCDAVDTPLAMYAHASAGCVHLRPIVNLKDAQGIRDMETIARMTVDLVLGYHGVLSSEHGDGRVRSWLNRYFFGDEVYEAFRQVKAAFDPEGRLNPGNIVDALPIDRHLRFGADYQTVPLYENLDWSADHGFAGAVEMCNGAAVCRKVDGETMCPSYMVTFEEEHSTRGRANLLRAAMMGLLPRDQLFGERMAEVMELCISCKACKTECPSRVDMAKIKLEWQGHYWRHHAPSLRTRLFAHMPLFSRIGSRFAPLANAVLGFRLTRNLLDLALGIDRRRKLPSFEPAFTSQSRPFTPTGKKVVLYVDTWANYHETAVAQAAWDVLTAVGYEVIVPGYACCGRTYLSKGFVDRARQAADRVMNILAPYARAGVPIVGLEPSCILTVRDEHQYLSQHPDRETVAAFTFTFEEFAAQHADEWADLFEADASPVLMHGHCHQKAMVGTDPARTALGLCHDHVHEVDSGCCGMAGAFGYEKEHYDLSRQMAYRKLVPAMSSAAEDVTLVAAGTSCRHQIKDFAGKDALHPAQVLAGALRRKASSVHE